MVKVHEINQPFGKNSPKWLVKVTKFIGNIHQIICTNSPNWLVKITQFIDNTHQIFGKDHHCGW